MTTESAIDRGSANVDGSGAVRTVRHRSQAQLGLWMVTAQGHHHLFGLGTGGGVPVGERRRGRARRIVGREHRVRNGSGKQGAWGFDFWPNACRWSLASYSESCSTFSTSTASREPGPLLGGVRGAFVGAPP